MEIPNNDFKVGMKVVVEGDGYEYVDVVSEITKKGFVKVRGNLFRPTDGETAVLRTSDEWKQMRIYIPTADDLENIRKKVIIHRCQYEMRNHKNLTYDQAVKILEILK